MVVNAPHLGQNQPKIAPHILEGLVMPESSPSLILRIHNATCPGAVANVKVVQKVCPVCRSQANASESESAD